VLDAASAMGRRDELVAAMRGHVMAAAVGPVTAGPLVEAGVDPVVPERYRLGALIRLVCDRLAADQVIRLRAANEVLELRGRALTVGDQEVLLGPTALALFRRLAATDAVVAKRELLGCMPDGGDEHALEVAVSRLRRTLGSAGLISTVVKRGYRLNAARLPS
jgi:uroporphyrinogen-III synthase